MSKIILGVDISKKHFDVSLFMDNKHKNKKFSNDKSGFKSLEYWIEKYNIEKIHVYLESTGFYGENLAEFLHKDGYKVSIVNPSCIKSYARSKLCRHKTDKIDAQLIAKYCDKYTPDFWQPLPEESKEVRELIRCIDALKLQHGLPLVFPHIFRRKVIKLANRLIQEIFLIFLFLKHQTNPCHVEYNKHMNNM